MTPETPANPLELPLRTYVGAPTAKVLGEKLGLRTTGDLLHHYPRRYAERGELTRLRDLELGEHVTVVAEVEKASTTQMKARRGELFKATVTDGSAQVDLVFFRSQPHRRELVPGARGMFAGTVSTFNHRLQLTHPEYQVIDPADEGAAGLWAGRLIPLYPATAKCPSWKIKKAVDLLLDQLISTGWKDLEDPLPEALLEDRGLPTLPDALELVHRPADRADVARAQSRLKWDEAFVLQTALARRRAATGLLPAVPRTARDGGILESFDARLPFTLTEGQTQVTDEIFTDLASDHPMHRLLQGEVGSGKTMVALRAMLAVVDAGGQAAMLAPTEVLAQQHHRSITEMLGPLAEAGMIGGGGGNATRVVLLTGSMGAKARRQALLDAATGRAGIVIGTHALIEDHVMFQDLGLVVVDEQHRFGVEQRDALRAKSVNTPHLLVMTATPIPRTVAMTVFGDLETSVLDQLPAGRSPISTHVVPAEEKPHFLARAWERIREETAKGHQAYVVCPRIGDGEDEEARAAKEAAAAAEGRRPPLAVEDVAAQLAEGPLAGLRIAILHGRLPPEEKDDMMRRFAAGEIDVLVATTVIEVGVNVPNATAMVIMDAERFGVSQLHQLRGRVGRGTAPGLCLLVTDAPPGSASRSRLDAVAATTDGFELSRIDLEQRREGDVLGQAQSGGRSSLKMLRVVQDEDVIAEARTEATRLVAEDPELERHPALRNALDALVDPDRATYLEKG